MGNQANRRRALDAALTTAKSPQVGSQPIFCVARLMKPLLEQDLDPLLRRRPSDRSHAGVPSGRDFDVWRQARGIHKTLRVRDRPFVEQGDAGRERIDEPVSSVSGSDLFT